MIKYIGSKRLLVSRIADIVNSFPDVTEVTDVFSGTSRVGMELKKSGYRVRANDHNHYAHMLGCCHVAADADRWTEPAQALLTELQAAPSVDDWFTRIYCRESRFFHPDNGVRIEGIRVALENMELDDTLRAIAMVALMEAADRVDSTTGVQMAYLKKWAPRALKPLTLRLPLLLPGEGAATRLDAADAAALPADLIYMDPPYNQHSYHSNYHIWETLTRWDSPEVYGVARKRIDCREKKNPFNSKRKITEAMARVIEACNAPFLVVSFNNEGFLPRESIEEMLKKKGTVEVFSLDHPRYVGSRIGIYNPKGEKVGRVTHTRNKELLFVVAPHESLLDPVREAMAT